MYHFTQGTLSLAFRNNDSQVTTLQEEDELPCLTLWQLKLLSRPLQPMRVNWHHVNFYAHITLLEWGHPKAQCYTKHGDRGEQTLIPCLVQG